MGFAVTFTKEAGSGEAWIKAGPRVEGPVLRDRPVLVQTS